MDRGEEKSRNMTKCKIEVMQFKQLVYFKALIILEDNMYSILVFFKKIKIREKN